MATKLAATRIKLKRAYDPPSRGDGIRVLVDRLWPRGVKKDEAAIDEWAKEISPSAALRKWFSHEPVKWTEFQRRYKAELSHQDEKLAHLRALARKRPLTLVYGARDTAHNHAIVLRDALLAH